MRWAHALPLLVVVAIGGCSFHRVNVAPLPTRGGIVPLPRGAAFHITHQRAPVQAVAVGTAEIRVDTSSLEEMLQELREKVRRLGGNLVARFRCARGVVLFLKKTGDAYVPLRTRISSTRIGCTGRIYRLSSR